MIKYRCMFELLNLAFIAQIWHMVATFNVVLSRRDGPPQIVHCADIILIIICDLL